MNKVLSAVGSDAMPFGNGQQARLLGEAPVAIQDNADMVRHLAGAHGMLKALLVEAIEETLKHCGVPSGLHCSGNQSLAPCQLPIMPYQIDAWHQRPAD